MRHIASQIHAPLFTNTKGSPRTVLALRVACTPPPSFYPHTYFQPSFPGCGFLTVYFEAASRLVDHFLKGSDSNQGSPRIIGIEEDDDDVVWETPPSKPGLG